MKTKARVHLWLPEVQGHKGVNSAKLLVDERIMIATFVAVILPLNLFL